MRGTSVSHSRGARRKSPPPGGTRDTAIHDARNSALLLLRLALPSAAASGQPCPAGRSGRLSRAGAGRPFTASPTAPRERGQPGPPPLAPGPRRPLRTGLRPRTEEGATGHAVEARALFIGPRLLRPPLQMRRRRAARAAGGGRRASLAGQCGPPRAPRTDEAPSAFRPPARQPPASASPAGRHVAVACGRHEITLIGTRAL